MSWTVEALVKHAERQPTSGVCEGHNWVESRYGSSCNRRTRWKCTRCDEWVCATHAHQHKLPEGSPHHGRRECERLVCSFTWSPAAYNPAHVATAGLIKHGEPKHRCTMRARYHRDEHACGYPCRASHPGSFVTPEMVADGLA